jgi:hypothetical protein
LAELGRFGEVSVVPPAADRGTLAGLIVAKLRDNVSPRRDLVPLWQDTADQLEAIYFDVIN